MGNGQRAIEGMFPRASRRVLGPDGVAGALEVGYGVLDGIVYELEAFAEGLLDAIELLHGVDIDLAHFAFAAFLGQAQDLFAALLGFVEHAFIGNEIFRAAAGPFDDVRGFLLRLGNDLFAVAHYALGLPYLAGDGDAHLLDELDEIVFLHHHPMTERNPLADPDHIFQLVQEVEDFDGAFACAMVWLAGSIALVVLVVAHVPARPAVITPNRSRRTAST